jgi:hypothetical protein
MSYISYTATQLGYKALRYLGALRPGQATSPDMLNDILSELNDMIDAWQLDRLKIWAVDPQLYTLTAAVQFYFIGPNATGGTINGTIYGAFNTVRPTAIEDANIVLNTSSPPVRRPIAILNADQWADIRVQSIPSAIPLRMWYDRNFGQDAASNQGIGLISLWPGPLAAYQLELYTTDNIGQLLAFANLTTAYAFPPGYPQAVALSLAEKIAPMVQVYLKIKNPLTAEVKRQAAAARAVIESYNAPSRLMHVDTAVMGNARGAWNYAIGDYNGAR